MPSLGGGGNGVRLEQIVDTLWVLNHGGAETPSLDGISNVGDGPLEPAFPAGLLFGALLSNQLLALIPVGEDLAVRLVGHHRERGL